VSAMPRPDPASEQGDLAAAEAARIGGRPSSEEPPEDQRDEAQRPLVEAGQGEAEGFEQAEHELIERASHGDQHAAWRASEDASDERDDARAAQQGDPDYERSSEREEDAP
jgi:hypothetical protein